MFLVIEIVCADGRGYTLQDAFLRVDSRSKTSFSLMTEQPLNDTQKKWYGNYPVFEEYFAVSLVAALGYMIRWLANEGLNLSIYCIKKSE